MWQKALTYWRENDRLVIVMAIILVASGALGWWGMTHRESAKPEKIYTTEPGITKLAGTGSPFIVFDKEKYFQAIADNKVIVLYFYSPFCTSCQEEMTGLRKVFTALGDNTSVAGFRVAINDERVTTDEMQLARQYGAVQATKVIVYKGKVSLNTSDTMTQSQFDRAIRDALKIR